MRDINGGTMPFIIFMGHLDECDTPDAAPEDAQQACDLLRRRKRLSLTTSDPALATEILLHMLQTDYKVWYECNDLQAHPVSIIGAHREEVTKIIDMYLMLQATTRLFVTAPGNGGVLTIART